MKFWKKTIAILLVHAFLLSSITTGLMPSASAATTEKASSILEVAATPDSIIIPKDSGMIKSKFTGKSDKLIVHIQDAHCNYEAQSNIASIIETLVKNNGLSLVSVEGADGMIDTSWFKAFPDAEVRKEVANYFMKKGEITGPEFLSITTDYPIKLFGAETRDYYIQNLNAFTTSYPLKAETEKYLNNIKSALIKLQGLIYNADLKAMAAKANEYEAKKIQFNDYVRFLQDEAERHKINLRQYEDLFKLINVLIYEKKIDFNVTDKERSALIDELSKAVSKDILTELVNKSIAFKVNKISSAEYYAYVRALAQANKIDLMDKYPNLFNYIIYNSVYSRINNEGLFNDIKKLEINIKEKLFENEDQKTLEKLSRHIDTLIGLVNIKLLNDEFDYYKANKGEFTPDAFTDFIKAKTIQFGLAFEIDPPADAVEKNISKLEDFYAIAIKRDKAMVDNTLAALNKTNQKIAVLVTGGFHSEGMTKLLEKEGISYVVVCPSITKDVQTPYIQILMNQRTSFEDILTAPRESVKKSMLATALKTWGLNLPDDEYKELQRDAPVLQGGGFDNFSSDWINAYIQVWLRVRMSLSGGHRPDREVFKDAFRMDFRRSAKDAGILDGRAEKILSTIIGSPEFDNLYHNDYVPEVRTMSPAPGQSQQGAMLISSDEDLSPERVSLINSAIANDFNNKVVTMNKPTDILNVDGIAIEIFVIPSLASCDAFLFAHPGHGGAVRAHSKTRIYFSPANYSRFNNLKKFYPKAYEQLLKHEIFHLTNRNATEKEAEDAVETRLVREALQAMDSADSAPMPVAQDREITLSEAYSSPEMFQRYVEQRIAYLVEAIPDLESRMKAYRQETDKDKKKTIAAGIDRDITDKYNSRLVSKMIGVPQEELTDGNVVRDIPNSANFRKLPSEKTDRYYDKAYTMMTKGLCAQIDLWAGAASRLYGEGQDRDPSQSFAAHDVYKVAVSRGDSEERLKNMGAIFSTTMATRMMVQEWLNIEAELRRHYDQIGVQVSDKEIRLERERIVRSTPRIIIVNDESGLSVVQEFVNNNFYGHDRNLVVFVVQATYKGFDLQSGKPVVIPNTVSNPAGHGEATMQIFQENRAFRVNENNEVVLTPRGAVDYLQTEKNGTIEVFVESRINDMIKLGAVSGELLSADLVDKHIFALALSLMGNPNNIRSGRNVVLELVDQNKENPIKGAQAVHANDKEFLVEMLSQLYKARRVLSDDKNPFNRFRMLLKAAVMALIKDQGLPVYFRFRDGYIYPETVTGDVTMLDGANAGWVIEEGRTIIDYKDDKTLPNGLGAALKQDRNLLFVKYTEELSRARADIINKNGGKEVTLTGIENIPSIGPKYAEKMKNKIREDKVRSRASKIYSERPTGTDPGNWQLAEKEIARDEALSHWRNERAKETGSMDQAKAELSAKISARAKSIAESPNRGTDLQNWVTAEFQVADELKSGLLVGAIRGSAQAVTNDEHGARQWGMEGPGRATPEAKTINGIIGSLIAEEKEKKAYTLTDYKPMEKVAGDFDIQKGSLPDKVSGKAGQFLNQLSELGLNQINVVVIKGLRDKLVEAGVAPDLMLHYGQTRNSVYVDEEDLMSLLEDNGTASIEGSGQYGMAARAIYHESVHLVNPSLSEADVAKKAPVSDIIALLSINAHRASMRRTLDVMKITGKIEGKRLIILHDTALGQGVAQAADNAFEREELDKTITVLRGSADSLMSRYRDEFDALVRNGVNPDNIAVVALTGSIEEGSGLQNSTTFNAEQILALQTFMQERNADIDENSNRGLSTILRAGDQGGRYMSNIALYEAAISIGFNIEIARCLNRIGLDVGNQQFDPGKIIETIKRGILVLIPITPIDGQHIDDVRRAEAAALRSL